MRIIGNDPNTPRQTQVVASGTLSTGDTVVVNSDGTVSAISESSGTQSTGTMTEFDTGNVQHLDACFDSNAGKVVIVYEEGSGGDGTAIVGTVSGSTISFGTAAVFYNGTSGTSWLGCDFDSTNNKVVIAYRDLDNGKGKAVVGTVSGTSISFGTTVEFESSDANYNSVTFDPVAGKTVISYSDGNNSNYGTSIVGTVSGTSISFGSPVVFESANTVFIQSTFDSTNNKVLITYEQGGLHDGFAIAGTVSGTSISFGNRNKWLAGTVTYSDITHDPDSGNFVVVYDSGTLNAIVGTVSGDNITYGTALSITSTSVDRVRSVYNAAAKKHIVLWNEGADPYELRIVELAVDGTSVSKGTITDLNSDDNSYPAITYDSTNKAAVAVFNDFGNGDDGQAIVYTSEYTVTNLTAENFIGTVQTGAADGNHVVVNIIGAIDENQTGLTAGQSYYVQNDGSLGTTADAPSVFAGTAVSATKLIVKG